jgi:membrane-associated phospholipid phosphatase
LIPFWDDAIWVYLSIYLLMPIGPFLMQQREDIMRYALGVLLIGFIADVVFVFWPTFCPRHEFAGTNPGYRFLINLDNPFHALPSLHAAFAIFSAKCAAFVLEKKTNRGRLIAGIWVWAGLILVATSLTKQHMIADIITGGALGLAAYWAAFTRWNIPNRGRLFPELHANPQSD